MLYWTGIFLHQLFLPDEAKRGALQEALELNNPTMVKERERFFTFKRSYDSDIKSTF